MSDFMCTVVTSPWQRANRSKSLHFQYLENGVVRLKYASFDDDTIDVSWSQVKEVLNISNKQYFKKQAVKHVFGDRLSERQVYAIGMFARLIESGNINIPKSN